MTVNEVRGPPTTAAIVGFKIKTLDTDGDLIDVTNDPNTISLQASSPKTVSNPKLRVIFDEDSSRMTFKMYVSN